MNPPAAQAAPETPERTLGPWRWVDHGSGAILVSPATVTKIILAPVPVQRGLHAALMQRSRRGHLVPIDTQHPDMILLAASSDLLAKCELALAALKDGRAVTAGNLLREAILNAGGTP